MSKEKGGISSYTHTQQQGITIPINVIQIIMLIIIQTN